jgi:hypothetical protein
MSSRCEARGRECFRAFAIRAAGIFLLQQRREFDVFPQISETLHFFRVPLEVNMRGLKAHLYVCAEVGQERFLLAETAGSNVLQTLTRVADLHSSLPCAELWKSKEGPQAGLPVPLRQRQEHSQIAHATVFRFGSAAIRVGRAVEDSQNQKKEHRQDCLCHQATTKAESGLPSYGGRACATLTGHP